MHCKWLYREDPRPRECLAPQRAVHSMRVQCPLDVSPPAVCIFHTLLMPSCWWCGPEHYCTLYTTLPCPPSGYCFALREGAGLLYWIAFICQCPRLPITVLQCLQQPASISHQQAIQHKSTQVKRACNEVQTCATWHGAWFGPKCNTWMMQA